MAHKTEPPSAENRGGLEKLMPSRSVTVSFGFISFMFASWLIRFIHGWYYCRKPFRKRSVWFSGLKCLAWCAKPSTVLFTVLPPNPPWLRLPVGPSMHFALWLQFTPPGSPPCLSCGHLFGSALLDCLHFPGIAPAFPLWPLLTQCFLFGMTFLSISTCRNPVIILGPIWNSSSSWISSWFLQRNDFISFLDLQAICLWQLFSIVLLHG